MSSLDLIAFDADDTLWHNLVHFEAAEKKFGEILSGFAPAEEAAHKLAEAEKRNLAAYGYGVKGFTLSMIETAIDVSGGAADTALIRQLIGLGRDMLDHSIELLPYVDETLKMLSANHRLLLVTKGDLHHQERKVLASGLAHYFEGVEIVSDKTADTYTRICRRHGAKAERTLMAGNSIRSDVLPMIAAGGYGVYVPFSIVWDHEFEEVAEGTPRFFAVKDVRGIADVIVSLS